MRPKSVFRDESKLDINYVPPRLVHRDEQLSLLRQFFRFATEAPGRMSQRVLITGKIGTGKTALSQRFGLNVTQEARQRNIDLRYVHVNCRECKGRLFMILQQPILEFQPKFPRRGYSSEEALRILMEILDDKDAYLILALDELETLIRNEGSDAVYKLTRIQEARLRKPQRLSLICILRELSYLDKLDPSTRSTLQSNVIKLEEYSRGQLRDILRDRVALAFRYGAVPEETIEMISALAELEGGNARYAIELLWRAGKYADAAGLPEVVPEHVRKASASVYPTVRKEEIMALELHKKLLLLGIARRFEETRRAYLLMGEAEEAYNIVCEEFEQRPRRHTQVWGYVKDLSALGILLAEPSGPGHRGKTTIISLPWIPASDLERELCKHLSFLIREQREREGNGRED